MQHWLPRAAPASRSSLSSRRWKSASAWNWKPCTCAKSGTSNSRKSIVQKVTPRITQIRPADANNQVVTVEGGRGSYRRQPCGGCPWRVDATGEFPAEAFRHSASTAYDMAQNTFGCHEAGSKKPATCAGFLLRGADHKLAVRLGFMSGRFKGDVIDGGHELHDNYRAMAIANGVSADDAALAACRD